MKAKFASVADLEEKQATFVRLSEHCRGYTAAGDPNTGVIIIIIIGDDSVLIVDTQATPVMAARLVAEIRRLTDKPIKHVVLSHYHAVRVLGASAYRAEVLQEVIASQGTYEMIVERGAQDMPSEYERFPRLFQAFGSIPGLTRPTLVFKETMTLWMGGLEVRRRPHPRRHRRGLGAVREGAVFGRPGRARRGVLHRRRATRRLAEVARGLDYTTDFVATLFACVRQAAAAGMNLKQAMAHTRRAMDPKFAQVFISEHFLPFDVVRAIDEANGIRHPRIWTAARDREMWHGLQAAD